jgi:hypothetical protein
MRVGLVAQGSASSGLLQSSSARRAPPSTGRSPRSTRPSPHRLRRSPSCGVRRALPSAWGVTWHGCAGDDGTCAALRRVIEAQAARIEQLRAELRACTPGALGTLVACCIDATCCTLRVTRLEAELRVTQCAALHVAACCSNTTMRGACGCSVVAAGRVMLHATCTHASVHAGRSRARVRPLSALTGARADGVGAVPRLPSGHIADAAALARSSAVAPAGALRRSVRRPVRMLPCAARRSLLQAPAAGAARGRRRCRPADRSAVRTVATRMPRTRDVQHAEACTAPQRNVRQAACGPHRVSGTPRRVP